jgi:hypothetical protein
MDDIDEEEEEEETFRARVQSNIDYDFTNPDSVASPVSSSQDASSAPQSRGVARLSNLSQGRYDQLYNSSFMWANSTLRKNDWAWNLYISFSQKVNARVFPYNGRHISAFIKYLALDAEYSMGSIEDVIIPALKRIHIEKHCSEVSPDIQTQIKTAVRDAKSQLLRTPEKGKEAALITDVEAIIRAMPEGMAEKAAEASCYLFSVYTGARSVSCVNVKVQDILSVSPSAEHPNLVNVCVRLNRTKGLHNWNHPTTLEGTLTDPDPLNFVYWLNLHMTKTFGAEFNLEAMLLDRRAVLQRLGQDPINLWPWIHENTLAERFRRAARKAGLP